MESGIVLIIGVVLIGIVMLIVSTGQSSAAREINNLKKEVATLRQEVLDLKGRSSML